MMSTNRMTREARRRRLYLALAGLLVYVRESGSSDCSRNVRRWIHSGCQAERRTGQPAGGRRFRKQKTFPEKETSAFTVPRDLGFAMQLEHPQPETCALASPSSLPRTRSQFQPPKARTYVELALRPHDHVAKIEHNSSEWTACRLGGTGAEQASARRRTGLPWNQCTVRFCCCVVSSVCSVSGRMQSSRPLHAQPDVIACALGAPARTISETRPELRDGNLVWDD
ncbi:hypothetical protein EV715DRAFT_258493 [Schizophyllum commune]